MKWMRTVQEIKRIQSSDKDQWTQANINNNEQTYALSTQSQKSNRDSGNWVYGTGDTGESTNKSELKCQGMI